MRFSDNSYGGRTANTHLWDSIKRFFRDNNVLGRLIMINAGVWLILQIVNTFLWLFRSHWYPQIIQFLAIHSNLRHLVIHPWTLITYMFVHEGFWHLLFNMLWLYWFGKIFLQYLSQRQLLATYFMGGIAGALFYVLMFNVLPSFENVFFYSFAIGASASVMAIVTAIAFYVPNYRMQLMFIGPVKIYWIAIFFFVYDLLNIRSGNAGGHLSHIGGAMWGWFFVYSLRKGKDLTFGFSSFVKWFTALFEKKNKFKITYSEGERFTDEEYNLQKRHNQAEIDRILDKIAKSGYNSLNEREKDILFRASRK